MNPEHDRSYMRVKKITVLIVVLIIAAGITGWVLGRSDDSSSNNQPANTTQSTPNPSVQPPVSSNASGPDIKSLVSFTLPDGWKEASCPSAAGTVFVIPDGGGNVNCDANPSAPVKISVDPSNSKDCNQLQSVQNVSKHICVSEFINGKKSLKAETVYNKDSSYKKETAINAYYIDTGKGVVKVEYIHDPSSNESQTGFEQLAKSVQVK